MTCRCSHSRDHHNPLTYGSGAYKRTDLVCQDGDCRCTDYREAVARG